MCETLVLPTVLLRFTLGVWRCRFVLSAHAAHLQRRRRTALNAAACAERAPPARSGASQNGERLLVIAALESVQERNMDIVAGWRALLDFD
jgi:hypothetical protein